MAMISPENQWPPVPAHPEGGNMAWNEVFKITRDILLETKRRYKSEIRKAVFDHLILEIEDAKHRDQFVLYHGIAHPVDPERKKPFIVDPRVSVHLLNNLDKPDATQIASILCYEYAIDVWDALHTEESCEEFENEHGKKESWEIDAELDTYIRSSKHFDAEYDAEVMGIDDPEFVEFLMEQKQLREFYRAIVLGRLGKEHIAFL